MMGFYLVAVALTFATGSCNVSRLRAGGVLSADTGSGGDIFCPTFPGREPVLANPIAANTECACLNRFRCPNWKPGSACVFVADQAWVTPDGKNKGYCAPSNTPGSNVASKLKEDLNVTNIISEEEGKPSSCKPCEDQPWTTTCTYLKDRKAAATAALAALEATAALAALELEGAERLFTEAIARYAAERNEETGAAYDKTEAAYDKTEAAARVAKPKRLAAARLEKTMMEAMEELGCPAEKIGLRAQSTEGSNVASKLKEDLNVTKIISDEEGGAFFKDIGMRVSKDQKCAYLHEMMFGAEMVWVEEYAAEAMAKARDLGC